MRSARAGPPDTTHKLPLARTPGPLASLFIAAVLLVLLVQGVQTAVILHDCIVKDMVSYHKSIGLLGRGSDR